MAQHNEAALRMTKARNQMICTDPFFATLALRLQVVEDTTCDTMWTDGVRLGYSPDFVMGITPDEIKGVIVHEVLHAANKHHLRRGQRDHKKWNVACDLAINPIVIDAGYKLPQGCLYEKAYHGKCAEEIYPLIPDQDGGQEGGGNDQGGGDDQGGGGKKGKDRMKGGQVGEVRDFDPHEKDKTGRGPTEDEKAQDSQGWDRDLNNAQKAARAQGKHVHDSLKRMIGDIMEPRIPWRDIAQRWLHTEITRNNYSWQRQNVRHLHRGFILPSLYSTTIGKVAVACDTSGSVDDHQLRDMIAEIVGVMEMYEDTVEEVEIPVIYCDSIVRHVDHLTMGDIHKVQAHGGGGTDYVPVFDWLDKQDDKPVALIYLTDGYCNSFPQDEPSIPVLWGLTVKNHDFRPPFGETMSLWGE